MKKTETFPMLTDPAAVKQPFPDWLLELYLTGTWALTGIESYDPPKEQWLPADEFTPGECYWDFRPHPHRRSLPEAFLPGCYRHYLMPGYKDLDTAVWYFRDGELILEREEPLEDVRVADSWTENYRIEPVSPDRCVLYTAEYGPHQPQDFTWRYYLNRLQ